MFLGLESGAFLQRVPMLPSVFLAVLGVGSVLKHRLYGFVGFSSKSAPAKPQDVRTEQARDAV